MRIIITITIIANSKVLLVPAVLVVEVGDVEGDAVLVVVDVLIVVVDVDDVCVVCVVLDVCVVVVWQSAGKFIGVSFRKLFHMLTS